MLNMFVKDETAAGASRGSQGRWASDCFHAALGALAVCAMGLPALSTGAQTPATPVHLWVAGRLLPLKPPAVWTGRDTFVPLSALPAIGARGALGVKRDGVTVRLRSGRVDVLPYERRSGVVMISLTDLSESADASVIGPSATPANGLKPNTAYLLAHITDVHLRANEVRIVTSFPVPFVSASLVASAHRGYIDCIGAVATRDFKASRLPASEKRAERFASASSRRTSPASPWTLRPA